MRRERSLRSLPVLLWLAALVACGDKAAAPVAVPAVEVKTLVATPQAAPMSPEFVGQTESSQQVEVRARVSGFLEQRVFTEGSTAREVKAVDNENSKNKQVDFCGPYRFPEPTHTDPDDGQNLFGPSLTPYVTCQEAFAIVRSGQTIPVSTH